MNTKQRVLFIFTFFLIVCFFLLLRGCNAKITETIVSDVIKVGDREFYLTISGQRCRSIDDGPFEYHLMMNTVTQGERIQKLIDWNNEVTRQDVHSKILKGYVVILGVEIPHIYVKHDGRDMGIFHIDGLRFIRTRRTLDLQNTHEYSIKQENARNLLSEQIDPSRYDSYYYVDESLCGASSKTLISREERSLIILGDNFVNHAPIYTKGDVYVSTTRLMDVVASDNTIFIVESEEETKRRKHQEGRKESYLVGREIVEIQRGN